MKFTFTITKFLGVVLGSLNIRDLDAFTQELDNGTIQREILVKKFRKEITNVFENRCTKDLHEAGSDVEKIYDDMRAAYFQSIFSKKRSNFSSQKKIFKYCCLLFFKEKLQGREGSKNLGNLDAVSHHIISRSLSRFKDRFFLDYPETSDIIDDSAPAEHFHYDEDNIKRILSYYLRVLSRLSSGMKNRFVLFSSVNRKILSLIHGISANEQLSKEISTIFHDLDSAAQNCPIYFQETKPKKKEIAKDKLNEHFIALSEKSIDLLKKYKISALRVFREKIDSEDKKRRGSVSDQKFDEFKLINLFNLAISSLSFCCAQSKNMSVDEYTLKSFTFDLLSYYMHKAIDCRYLDSLQENVEKNPKTSFNPALDKVLSEVFLDSRRVNKVASFKIKEKDLYSVKYKPKELVKNDKNEGVTDRLVNSTREYLMGFLKNPLPGVLRFVKSKAKFDVQYEKLRKERRDALKYINQKEDSFTTNEDLEETHPLLKTRSQRCYYTKYFKNLIKSRNIDVPDNIIVYLGNYVDEAPVLMMEECVEILKLLRMGNKLRDLDRISSDVRYNELESNKKYIKKLLLNEKSWNRAFRPIILYRAYKSASDQDSDKDMKIDDSFVKKISEKYSKKGEHLKLRQTYRLLILITPMYFAIFILLGYKIYLQTLKAGLRGKTK